jgi:drug/metabolite transporter (DMT)-like permease
MTGLTFAIVLVAATFHALWNFAAKKVSGNLSVLWLGLCAASVLSWPFALGVFRAEALTSVGLACILATGTIHAVYFGLIAQAYQRGDISLVYPVARGTGVAGTAVLAWLWLRESLTLPGVMGIVIICLGTALLGSGQRSHREGFTAYLYALSVGLTIALYSVVDKRGVGLVHPIIYISTMSTLAALILLPYMTCRRWPECRHALKQLKVFIGLIGVGSIGTYLMILFAYRLGPASYIVAVREFSVVIGALLGFIFLRERITLKKVVGMAAIVAGIVLVKTA